MEKNTLEYSIDNGKTWILVVPDNEQLYLEVNAGDEVLFRGGGFENRNESDYYHFNIEGDFDIEGNIMSLIDSTNFATDTTLASSYTFYHLFGDYCAGLTSAENLVLPATTLAKKCYWGLFRYCPKLTSAPELPATTLAEGCYCEMFNSCSSLTTAPELPATTLASECYRYMFNDCTSLTIAPELPATTLASGCYHGMFAGCTGLTTAPELPATTLADRCYYNMFSGCTSLNYIKCLATDISASYCTYNWVYYVASGEPGTFVGVENNPAGWYWGESGVPNGWDVNFEPQEPQE